MMLDRCLPFADGHARCSVKIAESVGCANVPPKVTYGLTNLGREVHVILKSFDTIGRKVGSAPTNDLP